MGDAYLSATDPPLSAIAPALEGCCRETVVESHMRATFKVVDCCDTIWHARPAHTTACFQEQGWHGSIRKLTCETRSGDRLGWGLFEVGDVPNIGCQVPSVVRAVGHARTFKVTMGKPDLVDEWWQAIPWHQQRSFC
jgi:hypothetical protein